MEEMEVVSSQLNKLKIRIFEDGTLSFFASSQDEEIPLTFNPESAANIKQFLLNQIQIREEEYKKENRSLIEQLKSSLRKNLELESHVNKYKEMTEYVKSHRELKTIKSGLITDIDNLKPNTRKYVCTNGVLHNEDVLIDVNEVKEAIKTLIDGIL